MITDVLKTFKRRISTLGPYGNIITTDRKVLVRQFQTVSMYRRVPTALLRHKPSGQLYLVTLMVDPDYRSMFLKDSESVRQVALYIAGSDYECLGSSITKPRIDKDDFGDYIFAMDNKVILKIYGRETDKIVSSRIDYNEFAFWIPEYRSLSWCTGEYYPNTEEDAYILFCYQLIVEITHKILYRRKD